jgi:hypothetical protein
MNMPRSGPSNDEVLAKLVRLAEGDTELVNAAIREASVNGSASLEKVVEYIVARKRGTRAPEAAA